MLYVARSRKDFLLFPSTSLLHAQTSVCPIGKHYLAPTLLTIVLLSV